MLSLNGKIHIFCVFISENFLKKIRNNFLVCDQYKIMQRIVCRFLFHVHKNVHVSSNAKNFPWTCWFLQPSSLPDLLEKSISIPPASSLLTVQRLAVWFYAALQWNCFQWALNSWIEWLFLSVCIPYPSLCLQHLHHWATFPGWCRVP